MVRCTSCGLHYVRPAAEVGADPRGLQAAAPTRTSSPRSRSASAPSASAWTRSSAWRGRPGKRVLDVGAAGGSFLSAARERGYEPHGCEPSTWMCAVRPRALRPRPASRGRSSTCPLKPGTDRPAHAVRRHRAHARPAGRPPPRLRAADARRRARDVLSRLRQPGRADARLALAVPAHRPPLLLHPGDDDRAAAPHRLRAAGLQAAPADPRARLRRQARGALPRPARRAGDRDRCASLGLERLPFQYWVGPDHGRRAEGRSLPA